MTAYAQQITAFGRLWGGWGGNQELRAKARSMLRVSSSALLCPFRDRRESSLRLATLAASSTSCATERSEAEVQVPERPFSSVVTDELQNILNAVARWVIATHVRTRSVCSLARHAFPEPAEDNALQTHFARQHQVKVARDRWHSAS